MAKAAIVSDGRPWAKIVYDIAKENLPTIIFQEPKVVTETANVLFFPFYSSKIAPQILEAHTCIGFHMTDLPYGRGGSPLQNLIARGFTSTKICAFRMTNEFFDVGPVYLREPMSLHGSAEEIYVRAAYIIGEMIPEVLRKIEAQIEPIPQTGEVVTFRRRTPTQSVIESASLDHVFNHIRMLDAEGYPHAFIECDGLRYEFTNAVRRHDRVEAIVTIREVKP